MKRENDPKPDITEALDMHPTRKLTRRPKWIIIAALAVALAIVLLAAFRAGGKSGIIRYKTEQVRQGDLTVMVTATGTLQPTNKVDVGSELSGIIKSVEADYNSTVRVGQVLARLDTIKLEAQLTQSKAALEAALAKVLQTKATVAETRAKLAQLQKVKELSKGKVPSQLEIDAADAAFERAKADEASARASVLQAEATLKANETDLYKSVIRSPINGIVLTRAIERGQTVAASFNTPVLFTLAEDLAQMDLHVNVDEADVGKIRDKQKAAFTVAAYPNRSFEAHISQVRFGSSTTSGVVTYETVLKVNNSELLLRPGMTATCDIVVKKIEKALLIPGSALRFSPPVPEEKRPSGGLVGAILPRPPRPSSAPRDSLPANKKQQRVWTLRDNALTPVTVTIGATNGGLTEVVGGDLRAGMDVVVDVVQGAK